MEIKQEYKIGDSYKLIKELPPDSVDLIVTDPPYGYQFMGLDWDKVVPKIEIWQECLRVLKPGAFAFIMSSPRQDVLSQMIVRIGQSGFKTNFTSIYWTYASGFPKASNIGKVIDKNAGVKREVICQKKPNPRDKKAYTPNSYSGIQGTSTFEKNPSMNMITDPSSIEAKILDGSYAGFQPKPALECIIVAMKPLSEKTYVEQALKNGKGITWLDDGRIPYQSKQDFDTVVDNFKGGIERSSPEEKELWRLHEGGWRLGKGIQIPTENKGRFPANLLVGDDVLNDGNIRSSCQSTKIHEEYGDDFKFGGGISSPSNQYSDSGSYSRYFDLDKWFDETIKKLPREVQDTFPFLIVTKPSKREKNEGVDTNLEREIGHNRFDKCVTCGNYILQNPDRPSKCICENPVRKNNKINGNFHPTVKPLKLFSYLITIGSREGDNILDPFLGSGTLLRACSMLNRNGIGFELNPEYEPIIRGRTTYNNTKRIVNNNNTKQTISKIINTVDA